MGGEGFASWVFRRMHMGCWGEDVGVIGCSGVYGIGLGRRVYSSGLRNSHKLDLRARVAHSVVAYDDLPRSLGQNWHASKPSMLCVLALRKWVPQSLMIAFGVPNREKRDFKNFTTTLASLVGSVLASTYFESVVGTVVSSGRSTVASCEDVDSFLVCNTPPDHLIRTGFEKEMGHGSGNLRKILDKSSIETSMPEKTSDPLDGSWVRHVEKELPKTEKSSMKTSMVCSIMSWKIGIIHR
uniref:Uncharacterized protein n=1 Tax=Tanacetum cinerariifolium TaxID=118510 RepID=A0A6L2MB98_TANCI|nr:hypothetical protein [Tanacetum cinerariifolium]